MKQYVHVDFDNVVANVKGSINRILKERFPDEHTDKCTEEFHHQLERRISSIYQSPELFKTLEPVAGSATALDTLLSLGHVVLIRIKLPSGACSSFLVKRLEWISRHLGNPWVRRVVLSNSSTVPQCDVMISSEPKSSCLLHTYTHIEFTEESNWNDILVSL